MNTQTFGQPQAAIALDDLRLAEDLSTYLREHDWKTAVCQDAEAVLLLEDSPQVVLLSTMLDGVMSTELVENIRAKHPLSQIVLVSSEQDIDALESIGFVEATLSQPLDYENVLVVLHDLEKKFEYSAEVAEEMKEEL